jgi:cytochrome c oxidase subunit 3
MAVVFGTFFILPLGFSAHFVYDNFFMTIGFIGVGTPLLLAGLAKWVAEGLTTEPLPVMKGLASKALPIFIVSEVFIFLGFFTGYWLLRLSQGDMWPPEGTPHLNMWLPIVMTVVLVSSSLTYHVAEVKLEENNLPGFRNWVMITILLGAIFLSMTFYEYGHLLHEGFGPSTNVYSTAFYSITGFHASHVIVGLGIFIAVLIPAFRGLTSHTFAGSAGIYWHFVDIVWFFVISQIYYW